MPVVKRFENYGEHRAPLPRCTHLQRGDENVIHRTIRFFLTTALLICALLVTTCWSEPPVREPGLTFFGWSDQHVQTDGDGSHLLPAIDAMNGLAGTGLPEQIGGRVAEPAFVFGCGDVTEWPTTAAKNTYDKLITERLRFPCYDAMGNHDEGGKSPSPTIKNWIIARHGSLSYTFDAGGIRFIVLFSKYDETLNNPAQPITAEALDFLRTELDKLPDGSPAIAAVHLCFDAITNRDELIEAIGDANVLAVLGGHYHKAKVDRYRDIDFVQLPSPAPKNTAHQITVIRITPDRLVAVPYDYRTKSWVLDPRKVLDKPIKMGAGRRRPG